MACNGAATLKRMKHRNKIMKWLLENYTEPVYMPDCQNNMASLSDSFNIDNDISSEDDGYNPCGITMSILNLNLNKFRTTEDVSYHGVATFMRNIDSYLPKKLRFGTNATNAWCGRNFSNKETMSEETKELFDKVIDMLMQMKTRIENDLTCKYYMGGKIQHIEILKRRFKNTWSEKIETDNENHDHVDGGLTLEVKFEDA